MKKLLVFSIDITNLEEEDVLNLQETIEDEVEFEGATVYNSGIVAESEIMGEETPEPKSFSSIRIVSSKNHNTSALDSLADDERKTRH